MNRVVDIALFALYTIVAVWVVVFATLGLILSRHAGFSRTKGILVGVCLGPAGILWMLVRGRGRRPRKFRVGNASTAQEAGASVDPPL